MLRATFPAGTVSGAPKVRAMEIIDELEPTKRGPYAGVVGYLDFSGNLDTAIAIRTMVWRDGHASVQAGAGIVADSIAADEDLECRNKAKALLTALAAAAAKLEPLVVTAARDASTAARGVSWSSSGPDAIVVPPGLVSQDLDPARRRRDGGVAAPARRRASSTSRSALVRVGRDGRCGSTATPGSARTSPRRSVASRSG